MTITYSQLAQFLPMIGIFVAAGIGYFIYLSWLRGHHLKLAQGKIWVEFWTRGGRNYDLLCDETRGEVKHIKGSWGNKLKVDAVIKSPEGHEIGEYYVLPEMTFNAVWPPGKPKSTQITIRKTSYIENIPIPNVSVNPEKWANPELYKQVTAYLISTSKDESFNKSALEAQKEIYADLKTVAQKLKWAEYTFYASCGAAVGGLAGAAMSYQVMSGMAKLLKIASGG